jgi:hypothetical protein
MKKHNYKNCQCCACKSKRGEYTKETHPNFRHGETLKKHYCVDCKKEVSDYRVKRCKKCNSENQKICMLGDKNPAWKGGLPKCEDCGKEITNKKYKKCSVCYIEYMINHPHNKGIKKSKTWKDKISSTMKKNGITKGRNNGMFGKITHGKGEYYNNVWMRSSYEIAFAKWLDKNKIKWCYESKTFDLGNCTYTPDFYLPETDTYVEIKGYWREDAEKKFRLFKEKYSNTKIEIINKIKLQSLRIIN